MGLKAQLAADVSAVFMNPGEFAAFVRISGVDITGIWSDSQETVGDYHRDELSGLPLDVDARILEIPDQLIMVQPQEEIEVDGLNWIVRRVETWEGVMRLTLYRNLGF